jgi:hypothetical protein
MSSAYKLCDGILENLEVFPPPPVLRYSCLEHRLLDKIKEERGGLPASPLYLFSIEGRFICYLNI